MEFWLKSEADNVNFLLPVTPTRYDIKYANAIETVQAVVGDINIPTSYRLSTVKLDGFFTMKDYKFANMKTYEPAKNNMDYVELIKMFIAYKRIVRLIITEDNITRINLPYRVESIDYSESDGSGDITYSIILREHRELNLSSNGTPARPSESKNTNTSRTHTVVSGDTLTNLARYYYGNGDLWEKIYNANTDKIKNPDKIYTDQVFTIP